MRLIKLSLAMAILLVAPVLSAGGFHNLDGHDVNVNRRGIGANGYDVVAYHIEEKARQGTPAISHDHEGVRYYFHNDENKSLFASDPEKYVPAFGGWCAFGVGMAFGQFEGWNPGKYQVDPESFKIVEGRLMLFYKTEEIDALHEWNQAEDALLVSAEEHWKAMTK